MNHLATEPRLAAVITLLFLTNIAAAQCDPSTLTVAGSGPLVLSPLESPPSLILESVKPDSDPLAAPQKYGLTRLDLSTLLEVLPAIESWTALRTQSAEIRYKRYRGDIQIAGVSRESDGEADFRLTQGRFLNAEDRERRRNVCVISETTADKLDRDRDLIGARIQVDDQYFSVVGIFKDDQKKKNVEGMNVLSHDVFIPLSTMQVKMGDVVIERRQGSFDVSEYELSRIQLGFKQGVATRDLIPLVREVLKKNHPDNDYRIQHAE